VIQADQPTCFPSDLRVAVSSREDGTMLNRSLADRHAPEVQQNREVFCNAAGIEYASVVYQLISYGPELPYNHIVKVDEPNTRGVIADVLYTEQSGVGLFLPVADCVATVLYDPVLKHLALAHLGRHATLADTMVTVVNYMQTRGSKASDIIVWMAPSVKQQSYRMEYFDNANDPKWQPFCEQRDGGYYLDLQGYNQARAVECGVPAANIAVSPVDTATDMHYFSHSQGDHNGRFAVVATIRS